MNPILSHYTHWRAAMISTSRCYIWEYLPMVPLQSRPIQLLLYSQMNCSRFKFLHLVWRKVTSARIPAISFKNEPILTRKCVARSSNLVLRIKIGGYWKSRWAHKKPTLNYWLLQHTLSFTPDYAVCTFLLNTFDTDWVKEVYLKKECLERTHSTVHEFSYYETVKASSKGVMIGLEDNDIEGKPAQ